MTAITEQITNPNVIDAVNAAVRQGRSYEAHWDFYMNDEQQSAFSNDCRAFKQACEARRKWLTQ